jgi:tRNA-2-methylthio-N6-dimethylallyladenosine synthase
LLLAQQDEANEATIGKTMKVLFEKPGRDAGQLMGRSPWLQPVHALGPESLIGAIAEVKISRLTANSLHGALTESVLA